MAGNNGLAGRRNRPVLVSACLVGLPTRYDGRSKPDNLCLEALEGRQWVPFCPEQLGGLPTPREAASLGPHNGEDVLAGNHRVLTITGKDVSDCFIRGAYVILQLARLLKSEEVFLKADSPSCGWGRVKGVTATLLAQRGFRIREF